MSRTLARWLPAVVWAALIFRLSAVPGSDLPGRYGTEAHFAVYAVLGALLVIALGGRAPTGRTVALAVILASLYAVTDEYHQAFVPMRTPDVADWGVDTLGAFAGALGGLWLGRLVGRRAARAADRAQ